MKTTLYLIRHGQTEWNKEQRMQGWQNSDLTDLGKKQALLLGEKLSAEMINLDCLYSSPSPRALETRDIVNHSLNVPVFEEFGLQEINMGTWEGKCYEEIEAKYPEDWHRFWSNPLTFQAENKGETFSELSQRSAESISKIAELHEGKVIGLVSHRITIKTIVADLLHVSIDELEDVEPNSVTKISINDGEVTLDTYSDISHYSALAL